eukprot:CAMPEP_0167814952 /NCGR_PEP_ID=MMETSP0112_2-20121227/2731_1 /TAXON_ID=91324 /ORGANISM="Lotharella globosa, Strain CCCM811" /LENGTH=211 /DNA_ID=CAMNT_0007714275 /DNA_START=1 /DNA_END=636 /DNA_ORIENTATION=+
MHLASIMILIFKIRSRKNCAGISLKSQMLYVLVFVTRYLDLFWNFNSLYNWIMKVIFISTSVYIVYLMKFVQPICLTYRKETDDKLPVIYLIAPCAILALIFIEFYEFAEYLWTFSIYLEAVAILPQLMVVHEYAKNDGGFVENLTSHYVFTLGGYRFMYILNWIYRVATEKGYRSWRVWIAGLIQTIIYCDFFFYYLKAFKSGGRTRLPL